MSDESHAQHRPPVGKDPKEVRSAPTSFGQIYPVHDILGVIEDKDAGERALLALKRAGVPEDDADLLDPTWFINAQRNRREHQGTLARVASVIASEEGAYIREYEEEAQQGHWIIVVHAEQPETALRVRDVLKAHGARRLRHYQHHTVEDL